jgi:hypothetical protein
MQYTKKNGFYFGLKAIRNCNGVFQISNFKFEITYSASDRYIEDDLTSIFPFQK